MPSSPPTLGCGRSRSKYLLSSARPGVRRVPARSPRVIIDDAQGFTLNAPAANTFHAVVKSVDGPPEPRDPSWGKTFYSLRTPKSVFANMSPEQDRAWGDSNGMRIRVDPE